MKTPDNLSLPELIAQRDILDAQRRELEQHIAIAREAEKDEAAQAARKIIDDFNLTPEDLGIRRPYKARNAPVKHVKPKFKGPNGELWAGRGITPVWARDDKEKYRIK